MLSDAGPHQIALFKRQSVTPEATMVRVVPIDVTIWMVVVIVVSVVTVWMVVPIAISSCGWNRAADPDCADYA